MYYDWITMYTIGLTFHVFGFIHHFYTLFRLRTIDFSKAVDPRVVEMEDFGPRYITTWNFCCQTLYLLMAICVDLAILYPNNNTLQTLAKLLTKFKGYLYTVIIFPTTLFVALNFWTLYWIDQEFVLPAKFEEVAPLWINHALHTNILGFLVVELLIVKKGLPRPTFMIAAIAFSAFGLIYFVQFMLAYYQFGRWIYAFFHHLTWQQMFTYLLFQHILSLGFLRIGFYIQNYKTNKHYRGRTN